MMQKVKEKEEENKQEESEKVMTMSEIGKNVKNGRMLKKEMW
jgi:ribosomal protein S5